MSDRALVAAEKEVSSLRSRMAKLREEGKGAVKETVNTAAVMGSAFAFSYYESRYPDKSTILGLPAGQCRLPIGPAPAGLEDAARAVLDGLGPR